ncbi:hypothetical protein HPB51_021395 [Rhipicephalus microplus]|uniref:Uncharacterized protein n=1 Tax=Rhipicephalus microplus TaxID=6941 RepID=A0A9J6F836_RHIMP|nr:hypothetical protein HPB51_021395 [Rhipicephalus microplus]
MKSKLEAHYTQIVHTARAECAARVKRLHDELAKAEQQLRSLRQRHDKDPPSLDGKLPERKAEKRIAQETGELKYHATTSVAKNRESLADWSDVSVKDILYEQSELMKQLKSLSAIVDKLHVVVSTVCGPPWPGMAPPSMRHLLSTFSEGRGQYGSGGLERVDRRRKEEEDDDWVCAE